MSILIADAGGSGTQWLHIDNEANVRKLASKAWHPIFMDMDAIRSALCDWRDTNLFADVKAIHYYSAGVADPKVNNALKEAISYCFSAAVVAVETDILGAARACCGNDDGIVAILGTGSNSCYYDGNNYTMRRRGYGYILGDEGSGAVLGLSFLKELLYDGFPETVAADFFKQFGMTADDIIQRIYRQVQPNHFLASLVPFIHARCEFAEIEVLVHNHFAAFFSRMMSPYRDINHLPLHLVGSIGYYFESQLRKQAEQHGFALGKVMKSPLDALGDYHMTNEKTYPLPK